MIFNLEHVPFSRYGSYFTVGFPRAGRKEKALYIRTMRGNVRSREIFKIELIDKDNPVPYEITATPITLHLQSEKGYAEICIAESDMLLFHANGVGVRLSAETSGYDYAVPHNENRWILNTSTHQMKIMMTPIVGSLTMDAPWKILSSEYVKADFLPSEATGELEFAVEEFEVSYMEGRQIKGFSQYIQDIEQQYTEFIQNNVHVKEQYKDAGELAAYIDWSCVVDPSGYMKRPAMLMSKNWMENIWSWDNCFNAMALAKGDPQLAWDQFVFFDDFQHETGMYPDLVNDRNILWNFCKPPVQGWVMSWMMKRGYYTDKKYLEELYPHMVKWTNWWFAYSDSDHDGVPQYNHGNESGWDNSTVFCDHGAVETPDLCAFLILQMETLSDLAKQLGKADEAEEWAQKAKDTMDKMIEHFWREDHFVARVSGSHEVIDTQSLQLYLPVMLGKRLPQGILDCLLKKLKEPGYFLTPHGLATESLNSSFYEDDGYWMGPVWPPTSMIFIDALHELGEKDFAADLAARYCDMAQKSGMSENYDAKSGEGLCDRAHTWGASVFLVLASEYVK